MAELSMIVRYALMVGFGYLTAKGFADESLREPVVGLGMAVFAYAWKKFEDRSK